METSEYIEDDLDALLAEDEVIEDHGDEAAEDEDSERNDNELLLAHLLEKHVPYTRPESEEESDHHRDSDSDPDFSHGDLLHRPDPASKIRKLSSNKSRVRIKKKSAQQKIVKKKSRSVKSDVGKVTAAETESVVTTSTVEPVKYPDPLTNSDDCSTNPNFAVIVDFLTPGCV